MMKTTRRHLWNMRNEMLSGWWIAIFRVVFFFLKSHSVIGLLMASGIVVLADNSASACVCTGAKEPPCYAYQKASAVFVGRVSSLSASSATGAQRLALIDFFVQQPFKGVGTSKVQIETPTGTECDLVFSTGERYFVYAYEDMQTKRLLTGVCTRTNDLASAREDLQYVQDRSLRPVKTLFLGKDGDSPTSLLEGADVIVEGQQVKLSALANKQGAFTIELPRPGSYMVTLIASPRIELINHSDRWTVFPAEGRSAVRFEITAAEGECHFVDLSLWLTSRRK